MKDILIVKTSALGDIVQTYPVLHYLKDRFAHVSIDWVVERPCAPLVKSHPGVRRTLEIASRSWRKKPFAGETKADFSSFREALGKVYYDVIFDLQGNTKSALILALAKGKDKVGFSWKSAPEWPNCLFTTQRFTPRPGGSVRQDYLSLVCQYLGSSCVHWIDGGVQLLLQQGEQVLERPAGIVVCAGSNWPNKQLSKEGWLVFLSAVREKLPLYFSWGNAEEKAFAQELASHFQYSEVLPHLSLTQLQHFMGRQKKVFSVDSLPLHLAATTPVETFSVFGPSRADKYCPDGPKHKSHQASCPYNKHFSKRCPDLRSCKTGACLKNCLADELIKSYHR